MNWKNDKWFNSLIMVLLICLMAGCGSGGGGGGGGSTPPVPEFGSVGGIVTDGRTAVTGVTVQVVGYPLLSDITDTNGYYRIDNVPTGARILRFTKTGYAATDRPVTIIADFIANCDLPNFPASRPQVDTALTLDGETHAGIGTLITITGLGFGTTQGTVTFNNVPATAMTLWMTTQIKVFIPDLTTSGVVRVIASGVSSTENVNFTVDTPTLPPSISAITPDNGKVDDSVTITGSNFGDPRGTSRVTFFDGVDVAAYTSWTDTKIVCTVPANTTTGGVTATTTTGTSAPPVIFTVNNDDPGPWGLSGPINSYGGNGTGPGQFLNPIGIGIGPNGIRVIADRGNGRVQGINLDGSQSWVQTTVNAPFGVDVDNDNNSIIANQSSITSSFVKLDINGETAWTKSWTGPNGVTVPKINNPNNHAWLSSGNNTVTEIDTNGNVEHQWNIAELSSIADIAVDLSINTGWAIDINGNVAQINLTNGQTTATWPTSIGTNPWRVLKIPSKDLLMFTVAGDNKIVGYRTNNQLLWEITLPEADNPAGIAYDSATGNIHITNSANGITYVYQIVKL